LVDIQQEEQRQREAELAAARQHAANTGSTADAPVTSPGSMSTQLKSILGVQGKASGGGWSGATNTSGMTLREIMEQEQLIQASQVEQGARMPQAGSWAAKASTSGLSTSYAQPKPTPAVNLNVKKPEAQDHNKNIWLPASKPAEALQTMAKQTKSQEPSNMPREVAEWCEAQLKRINPQADPSLMDICFTFESAGDIREYVSQLLGSTPQASQFATEFIRRKESSVNQNYNSQMKKKKK
jgi:hypothetical protein